MRGSRARLLRVAFAPVALAALLALGPVGCSWLLGVNGDPVVADDLDAEAGDGGPAADTAADADAAAADEPLADGAAQDAAVE